MQTERSIILHQKGLLKEEKEPRRLRSDGAPLIKDIIRDCEAQGEYSRGVEVALHRIQNERTLKPAVVANMIRLMGKAGEAGTALDLFHGIGKAANMSRMKKDAFHYNAILSCLAKSNAENKLAEAIKIFEDMRQQKVRPNKFIYNTLIHIYIKEGKYGGAIRLFEEMSAEGIKADEAIYNSVITACNQEGLLVRAAGLFKVMERERYLQPAEHTYGAALSTAAKNRDANSAIELLNKAKKVKHIALNQVMYTNAMLACASDQHWEKGIALYEEMVSSTDLIPDRAVYVALLGCLANGRQGIRAQEILALLSSKNFACQANVYRYN